MLFYQPEPAVPEEEEYVWDPQPTDAQLAWDQNFHLEPAEAKDDVDEAYLAFYVDGEVIPNEHRQLGSFSPLVDKLSEVVRKFHHESDPTDNIVPIKEPRPRVTLKDDCLVMAIDEVPADLWDVSDIVDLNSNPLPEDLWDVDKVVDIQMGNEVWTVNSALVDAGFWDSPFVTNPGVPFKETAAQDPAFWEGLVLQDLETALRQDSPATVASVDKGKRKMAEIPTDFCDFDDKTTSWWDIANVTRSGRVFQPPNLQAGSSSNPQVQRPAVPIVQRSVPPVHDEVPAENAIQRQLEKIPAAVSVWGLIASSKEHREGLSLALSRITVPTDITPEAMVALVLPLLFKHSVTFTERDLPIEGTAHNRPLHITVKCKGLWIPTVLIDNGSAINVCPLRVAYRLGLAKKDFEPSNLAVKAYDSTRRVVEGTITLLLDAEGFEMSVEFHVVDIPATFNLLLGRPWMHRPNIMAVPSTLHQKVMLGLPTGTLTICGDSGIRPLKEDEPVLGIMHGEEDSDIGGFSFDTSGSVLAIAVADDFIISSAAFEIMRRMAFMPGFGLGINQQGITEFPVFPFSEGQFGLGYVPPAKKAKNGKDAGKLRTLYGNPNSYFVREGGGHAYVGQIEPFWDPETRAWLPGFEIFAADTWADSEEDVARDELAEADFKKQLAKIKERMDWLKTFDQGSLEMLFSQVGLVGKEEEAEVLMLGPDSSDALKDPTTLIVEAKGSINNCIFTPRLTCIDNESETDTESFESKSSLESELVPLGPPRHSFYFEFESTVLGNPSGFYEMHDPASDYFADFL
ncbi:hypothetical protein RHMOL_Rhmol11G0029500 [Rhododendron molle]|uniref:Uncharacterized protein n=1 Tax=Rhododendron molle TaxID=49168 RepID=A0ACC0LNA0_RHOML|nr:hypothetical protein RHMOL_Rhmol11G0029500 [Rhododendron molle]